MKVRSEAVAVPLAAVLVAAAFVVPHLHLGIVVALEETHLNASYLISNRSSACLVISERCASALSASPTAS